MYFHLPAPEMACLGFYPLFGVSTRDAVMTSSCCMITAGAAQPFPDDAVNFKLASHLPVACQSQEPHLYARKPLARHLTWQSSVNYPVTDNRAVILQTIKRAIERV